MSKWIEAEVKVTKREVLEYTLTTNNLVVRVHRDDRFPNKWLLSTRYPAGRGLDVTMHELFATAAGAAKGEALEYLRDLVAGLQRELDAL